MWSVSRVGRNINSRNTHQMRREVRHKQVSKAEAERRGEDEAIAAGEFDGRKHFEAGDL